MPMGVCTINKGMTEVTAFEAPFKKLKSSPFCGHLTRFCFFLQHKLLIIYKLQHKSV